MMKLELEKLRPEDVVGIYPIKGVPDRMPDSALYLHPEAAKSWSDNLFAETLIISDMLRTAESSLRARASGRGAQRPAYSGHNYGLSIDIDVTKVMKKHGVKKKEELDVIMEGMGWFCHRRDHLREIEEWHYNFLGVDAVISPRVSSTAGYIEAEIVRRYGSHFTFDAVTAQQYLAKLGYYGGDNDGIFGPRSKEALGAFQRAWMLVENRKLDAMTMRTLAFVSSTR